MSAMPGGAPAAAAAAAAAATAATAFELGALPLAEAAEPPTFKRGGGEEPGTDANPPASSVPLAAPTALPALAASALLMFALIGCSGLSGECARWTGVVAGGALSSGSSGSGGGELEAPAACAGAWLRVDRVLDMATSDVRTQWLDRLVSSGGRLKKIRRWSSDSIGLAAGLQRERQREKGDERTFKNKKREKQLFSLLPQPRLFPIIFIPDVVPSVCLCYLLGYFLARPLFFVSLFGW